VDHLRVVADVNVLVDAAFGTYGRGRKGEPLDLSLDHPGDILGTLLRREECSLWLSGHILGEVNRVLQIPQPRGGGFSKEDVEDYIRLLMRIATESGGGLVAPEPGVNEIDDYEDNLVLGTAIAAGARAVITSDYEFQRATGVHGVAIMAPSDFLSRMEIVRRKAMQVVREEVLGIEDDSPGLAL
jgi:predicted nucleic acid-binding protein